VSTSGTELRITVVVPVAGGRSWSQKISGAVCDVVVNSGGASKQAVRESTPAVTSERRASATTP
jgi:hypothetical protein